MTATGMIAAVASQLQLQLPMPVRTLRRGRNDEAHDAVCILRHGGLPSTEHVVPKWMRKVLQIREPVREFSGTAYVGAPLDAARAADAVDLAALLEADGARPAANGS